jgi:hypothetical protein
MKKLLVVLLGVLAVSVGSAQADWIKHEGHGAKGPGYNIPKVYFNQVKHGGLDGFVTACKAKCDEYNDTCGGFTLKYATSDRSRLSFCDFPKEGATLVENLGHDFYRVVTHDEVLARLKELLPNLYTAEDAEWLTEEIKSGTLTIGYDRLISHEGETCVEDSGATVTGKGYSAGSCRGWCIGSGRAGWGLTCEESEEADAHNVPSDRVWLYRNCPYPGTSACEGQFFNLVHGQGCHTEAGVTTCDR